ncbi:DUF4258 domain-containing protein [Candidatus Woesearchaeota archaeon]|nr:DUF4258 domain-containing protein [Candidatus Woesearchaeota archaeon]
MEVIYSDHAEKRIKQRGIAKWEVEHILEFPFYIKKSFSGRKEAVGKIKGRMIKIKFVEEENYIKIITVM